LLPASLFLAVATNNQSFFWGAIMNKLKFVAVLAAGAALAL